MSSRTGERSSREMHGPGRRTPAAASARSQQTIYLELAALGISPDVAALMADRHSDKVRPTVVRRLNAEQARDRIAAGHAQMDREIQRAGGPTAAAAATEAAAMRSTAVRSAQVATAATVARQAQLDATAALARTQPQAVPQPVQSVLRPVIIVQGPDQGGVEDLGNGTLVRKFEYTGKADGRKLRDQAVDVPSSPSAPGGATVVGSAAAMVGPGGPVGTAATPNPNVPQRPPTDPNIAVSDVLHVAAVAAGVLNPAAAAAMIVGTHLLSRVEMRAGGGMSL